jgi:hypothetical protein
MAVQIIGSTGTVADVDAGKSIYTRRGAANYGVLGGAFAVTGGPSSVVAAALSANTPLATLRHGTSATANMYITRLRATFTPATVGASGGVPGQIAWQKFTTATPSGGTARTVARKDASTGGASQVLDVRDSNAALTVTSVNFTDIFASTNVPNFTTGGVYEWVIDFDEDEFIRLAAGDGISLRTLVAMAATQTWIFAYTIHWFEK